MFSERKSGHPYESLQNVFIFNAIDNSKKIECNVQCGGKTAPDYWMQSQVIGR